jgi:hypothetical protein
MSNIAIRWSGLLLIIGGVLLGIGAVRARLGISPPARTSASGFPTDDVERLVE